MKKYLKIIIILLLSFSILKANNQKIRIAVANNLVPYSFVDNDNNIRGLLIDYWKLWSKKTGIEIVFVPSSISDTFKSIYNKETDVHFGMAKDIKKKDKIDFLNKIVDVKYTFHLLSENLNKFKKVEDLFDKKVAVLKDTHLHRYLLKHYPKIKVVPYTSYKKMIKDLEEKKTSSILASNLRIWYQLAKIAKISRFKKMKSFEIKKTIYSSIRKGDSKLKETVLKGLNLITKNDLYLLENKWDKSVELEKNETFIKISKKKKLKKSINIALRIGREPYSFEKSPFKGIEYDLIKRVFEKENININTIKYFDNINHQIKTFKSLNTIDLVSSVKENNDKLFYSDNFISFQNVVISRRDDNLHIDKIKDLENKSIIAFHEAYKYLGEEYKKLFNERNRTSLYQELILQEIQVQKFLNKEVDLIIIDENIFTWYLKKLSNKNISEFKFDYIFKGKSTFKIAFKDKELKEVFNKNLKIIKNNSEYEDIYFNYLNSDIEAKSKISLLFSSVISKNLYNNNIEEARDIAYIFFNLPFIEKIELYNQNNQREILYSNNELELLNFYKQDVFHIPFGIPQKIAYIKIYFNEKELNKNTKEAELIPNIELFKSFSTYTHIENIYRSFNYLNNKIKFTIKEKEFIKDHKNITYSTLNWEPISILYNKKLIGLMPDYLEIIENKTGLKFIYKQLKTWQEINNEFKDKKIDLIPKVHISKNLDIKALESNEITNFRFAIVTKENGSFADKISDLENKTLALPKGFPNYNFIKKHYSNIKIIEATSIQEALNFVSKGEAYAFIAFSEVAIYNVKKYFPNLKIAGITSDIFIHNFLIQKDYPELLSIINKVLKNISYKEKQDIRDKWIDEELKTAVDYTLIYELLILFIAILIIIFFVIKKLKKAKEEMEEQKKKFETLFSDTADAVILSKDGKYFDVNNATIALFNYKNKSDFLNMLPGTLAPKYQENGELSVIEMTKYLEKCYKEGTVRFQWESKKFTGEIFWVEFVITRLKYNDGDILHLLSRDINDKKLLEKEIFNRTKDLEFANDELEDSNEELQTTIQNLKVMQEQLIASEKMASLGGLVAGVAHEINTPVGIGLTGSSHFKNITDEINLKYKKNEMTQDEFEDYLDTAKELSDLIHKNLEKAANLVRSFKQVAVDQSSEEKRVFNAKRYLFEILASIHSVTKKTNVKIDISCDDKLSINSYPGAFSQVVTNLIMNSIIHGFKNKKEGNINIVISKENKDIKIIYKDNGSGIKKEYLSKIFDPFFTTNRENGGSGLGLNIIYNIITSRLNGSITCISEVNHGVKFTIILKV